MRKTAEDSSRKPLLFAENPFDEERLDDLEFRGAFHDSSYVPGYSEEKTRNQIRAAKGQPTSKIPRLQWIRVSSRDGQITQPVDEGIMEFMKLGYRACGVDDLKSLGVPGAGELPPTAYLDTNNFLIRRGDLALFIVGGDRAEKNRARERRALEAHEAASKDVTTSTGEVFRDVKDEKTIKGSLEDLSKIQLPNLE